MRSQHAEVMYIGKHCNSLTLNQDTECFRRNDGVNVAVARLLLEAERHPPNSLASRR
jgi:hypothetical protein